VIGEVPVGVSLVLLTYTSFRSPELSNSVLTQPTLFPTAPTISATAASKNEEEEKRKKKSSGYPPFSLYLSINSGS
jgi:hypothetical protein